MTADDIRLQVHIRNTKPVELLSLTQALLSINAEYGRYIGRNPEVNTAGQAKLYIKEIKAGSIVIELADVAMMGSITIIPFMENANTIIGFAQYCRQVFGYFLGKGKEERPALEAGDCKNFHDMLNPIIADDGSRIEIGTVINGNVNVYTGLDSIQSNTIQNEIRCELESLKIIEKKDEVHEKVLMTWFNAYGDKKKNNRGVIDSLYAKPLKVLFDDESIKSSMLYGVNNPLTTAYEVDVKVETSQNIPIAYRVVRLHDQFEIDA